MVEPKVRFKRDDGSSYPKWSIEKLGDICEPHARIGWQNLRTDEFLDDGDYYLITGTDFHNGSVNFHTCHYIDKNRYDQDKNIQIENGHVLITKDGTLGKVALVSGMDKPGTLNAGVFVLQNVAGKIYNMFLYQYLAAPFLLRFAAGKSTGGTIQHLNQGVLVDFEVPIPCIEEQQKIADFLSSVDDVIAASEQEVANLETQKKAVMKKIFSQEVRFKREDGNDFPEWAEKKVAEACSKLCVGFVGTCEKYYTDAQNGIPMYRTGNIKNGQITCDDMKYVTKEFHQKNKKSQLHSGDVLIARFGDNGLGAIYNCVEEANCLNCIIAHPNEQILLAKYFQEFLGSDVAKKQVSKEVVGSTFGILNTTSLGGLTIVYPCIEEQRLIADFLSDFDEAIFAVKKELELWKELKKGLLQQMFV